MLVDGVTERNHQIVETLNEDAQRQLESLRDELFGVEPPLAVEARIRYAWVREQLKTVQSDAPAYQSWVSRVIEFANRPIPGTIGLFLVMAIVFQSVFAWAAPLMEWIDGGAAALGAYAAAALGDGWFSSLIADGVIAGVGSVVVFLPQILILFLFVIVLEDTGYLARAAYLMDRVMRSVGLSGPLSHWQKPGFRGS